MWKAKLRNRNKSYTHALLNGMVPNKDYIILEPTQSYKPVQIPFSAADKTTVASNILQTGFSPILFKFKSLRKLWLYQEKFLTSRTSWAYDLNNINCEHSWIKVLWRDAEDFLRFLDEVWTTLMGVSSQKKLLSVLLWRREIPVLGL